MDSFNYSICSKKYNNLFKPADLVILAVTYVAVRSRYNIITNVLKLSVEFNQFVEYKGKLPETVAA